MIIVSQDRESIFNFNNLRIIETDEKSIVTESNGFTRILGEYETEERAKEILEEIIQFCADNSKTNLTENLMLTMYNKNFGIKTGSISSVFYMPEE